MTAKLSKTKIQPETKPQTQANNMKTTTNKHNVTGKNIGFGITPERSLYLMGEINDQSVDALTPKIINLINTSSDPITLYINSDGGNVAAMLRLYNTLTLRGIHGRSCLLNTVALETVASAAAILLLKGDFAIAHENSEIIFHGSRILSNETTSKEAMQTWSNLYSDDLEEDTKTAAFHVLNRQILNYSFLLDMQKEKFGQEAKHEPANAKLDIGFQTKMPTLFKYHQYLKDVSGGLLESLIQNSVDFARKHLSAIERIKSVASDKDFICQAYQHQHIDCISNITQEESNKKLMHTQCVKTLNMILTDWVLLPDNSGEISSDKIAELFGKFYDINQVEKITRLFCEDIKSGLTLPVSADVDITLEDQKHMLWYSIGLCRQLSSNDVWLDGQDAYELGLIDDLIS